MAFRRLRILSLANCTFLEDEIVKTMILKADFANLERLNLNSNARISDDGLRDFVKGKFLERLKEIDMTDLSFSPKSDYLLAYHVHFKCLETLTISSDRLEHFMKSKNTRFLKTLRYSPGKVFPRSMPIY